MMMQPTPVRSKLLRNFVCTSVAITALAVSIIPAVADPIAPPAWHAPSGVLRVWGTPRAGETLARWQSGFRSENSDTHIAAKMTGSDIAMAGLYTGQADIALIGREATDSEIKAFEWVFHYRPTRIEVATGSLASAGRSPALAVFVHRSNPLSRIELARLAAIFGADPPPGSQSIRSWGDLGLDGEWASRRIHLYAPDSESGTGVFFRARTLGGASKMNWNDLDEFAEPARTPGGVDVSTRSVLRALAKDRYGMAIADLAYTNADVKALPLKGDGEFYLPTRSSLIDGTYPLRRTLYAYINVPAHTAPDARVDQFLRYVLDADGQRALGIGEDYLPLGKDASLRQLRVLDELSK